MSSVAEFMDMIARIAETKFKSIPIVKQPVEKPKPIDTSLDGIVEN